MAIRGKTKHRLLIVLLVFALAAITVLSVYVVRSRQIAAEVLRSRERGFAALQGADYHTALHQIGRYVQRHPSDVEALHGYAQARENVPLQGGAHLLDAAGFYRRVLDLQPQHIAAAHGLLELYIQLGYNAETLALAEQLLERDSTDAVALRAKATALARSRKYAEALAVAQTYNQLVPMHLEFQLATLQIMRQAGHKDPELLAHAEAVRTAHPDDPRSDLLQAGALLLVDDRQAALQWVRKAASRDVADPEAIVRIVAMLDGMGQFADATRVVERAAGLNPGRRTMELLVGRWWQLRRWDRVAEYVGRLEHDVRHLDSRIAALYATALIELGRRTEAGAIVDVLEERPDDAEAAAWRGVIAAVYESPSPQARAVLEACDDAVTRVPASPYFRFLLARAYQRVGEPERALQCWRQASEGAAAWPAPFIERARLLLALGRTPEALAGAQEAARRAPDDPDALGVLALAGMQMMAEKRVSNADALQDMVKRLEAAASDHEPSLAVRVMLLAQAGQRESAVNEITRVLQLEPAPTCDTLLALAAAGEKLELGLEEQCYSRCRAAHGTSANLVYAQALMRQRLGRPQEGVELFAAAKSQLDGSAPLDLELAEARYLDVIGDASAQSVWTALADAHPEAIEAQWGAVAARSLAGDRAARERALERLKEQIGPRGVAWRLARARWLLEGEPTEKQIVEAAALASEVTRIVPDELPPRLLLARCMERLNNPAVAIEQLTIVTEADHANHEAAIWLSRLLHARGETARARACIDRVLKAGVLPASTLRQVAAALAQQGDTDRAASLYEALRKANASSVESDLTLARVHWQRKQFDRVDAILGPLLANPDQSVIRFALDYYLSQGRRAEARDVLGRLDQAQGEAAAAAVIRGDYYTHTGEPDQALQAYLAGTKTSPASPVVWRSLILHYLSRGQADEALSAAQQAVAAAAADKAISTFLEQRDAIAELGSEEAARPLIAVLLTSPDDVQPACEAIRVFGEARKAGASPVQIAGQLRPLADRNPRLLPLQLAVARLYLAGSRHADAIAVAGRAVELFPYSAEAARLAAASLALAGRHAEALSAAQRWRDVAPGEMAGADIVIANAYLGLNQPDKALKQVQPYMEAAWQQPDDKSQFIVLWAQAKLRTGGTAEVREAMLPLIRRSPSWRAQGMRLGADHAPADTVAADWLNWLTPLVPADAIGERIHLAQAWQSLASRTHSSQHQASARQIVAGLGAEAPRVPNLPPEQAQLLAVLCEMQGDRETAGILYRRALQGGSQLAVSMNNLAMLLADGGGDLAEAESLAAAAVERAPDSAAYRDTLACIRSKRGQPGSAVESLSRAVELQPDNCAYRIRLAWALLADGQQDKAKQVLKHVETFRPDAISLSERDREQLQLLRTRLTTTQ